MEAAGLIRRLPDPDDRRGTIVEPTELGLAMWDKTVGASARREAAATSLLSQADKERLHDLLRHLMQAFPNWKAKKHAQPAKDADSDD
jgi:DNA-binding MarR family transcriptional regulator